MLATDTTGVEDVAAGGFVSSMVFCTTEVARVVGTTTGVVEATTSVVVVGGCAAAAVTRLPVRVVRERGTAVHRWPSMVVIENPAGRFGLDMMQY